MKKIQIAKIIFLNNLEIMKKILDLIAFKVDKKSDDYKYYKREIMNNFYQKLGKLFKQLSDNKIIEKCPCGHSLRKGYSDCSFCGGSGYKDKKII